MSLTTDQIKSHAKKASVETAALKAALVNPLANGQDKDLLFKASIGIITDVERRDLIDLAEKLSRA